MVEWPGISSADTMMSSLSRGAWSDVGLPDPHRWPSRLQAMVDLIAASPQPMAILWGDRRARIHNDAYETMFCEGMFAQLGTSGRAMPLAPGESLLHELAFNGTASSLHDVLRPCEPGLIRDAIPVDITCSPLPDEAGGITGVLLAFLFRGHADKPGEENILAQSRARQEGLHSLRNALGVVRMIIRRTMSASLNRETALMHMEGRIDAFSRIQMAIGTAAGARGIYLADVIGDELAVHLARDGEALVLAGPELELSFKTAEMLALAFHELATNAVKYGALSVEDGKISVTWAVQRRSRVPWLILDWKESGVFSVRKGQGGFGTELLLLLLPDELGAVTDLDFQSDGLEFHLELPLQGGPFRP
ncbi:HWE histidine kinase domain-containing protein [Novosphingobium sp. 9]|uniref:HWE histidine kinase domain-containing protein n=1 Tax=Novosphingobium sp. 9 TaxID=2025349 RepID=UPI0021B60E17|nr:HWE histidine kinase domain-containing protein [Novosphingobium sp. 9]